MPGVNLGFELGYDLRGFLLALHEAIDPIFLISGNYLMFTVLKGFNIASMPSMPLVYYSDEGSLLCF